MSPRTWASARPRRQRHKVASPTRQRAASRVVVSVWRYDDATCRNGSATLTVQTLPNLGENEIAANPPPESPLCTHDAVVKLHAANPMLWQCASAVKKRKTGKSPRTLVCRTMQYRAASRDAAHGWWVCRDGGTTRCTVRRPLPDPLGSAKPCQPSRRPAQSGGNLEFAWRVLAECAGGRQGSATVWRTPPRKKRASWW